jgi:hypothetical protein
MLPLLLPSQLLLNVNLGDLLESLSADPQAAGSETAQGASPSSTPPSLQASDLLSLDRDWPGMLR